MRGYLEIQRQLSRKYAFVLFCEGGETQQKAEISTGAIMIKVVLKIANGQ